MLLTAPTEAPARGIFDPAAFGDRVAVRTATEELSYADLGRRVAEVGERLGSIRRLVLLETGNDLDSLVTYLAALRHRHPVLLVPAGRGSQLAAAYDPDVVGVRRGDDWRLTERREGTAHDLHPDLAVLLSTSGSTGSPKLVRLSHANLESNARAIAAYLGLTEQDRAITSLPMHYCYGLSVINSHLVAGAGLVLTDHSVLDAAFWELFHAGGATSFAGVPYTFDLLDRSGFADRHLPTLRYVTQAGGRMAPDRVRAYAELGRRRGWDLVVMYGQTEATARMSWLPPDRALNRPGSIGVPIPGGSFRIDIVPESPDPDTGELVYTGPNVMMGYAESPPDLAVGATLDELRTGDLARVEDGLYELVGRRGRFAKVFGLRIDLDRVERKLAAHGTPAECVAVDDTIVAFTRHGRDHPTARAVVSELCDLPDHAIRTEVLACRPLTPSGKTDYAALERQARLVAHPSLPANGRADVAAIREQYALVLGRPDAIPDSSFVGLGGDSLSYVELSTRLGRLLGHSLPAAWHTMTIRQLADPPPEPPKWRRGVRVETSVFLRALAIVAIVGSHADVWVIEGGAHLLLAVAGYNFARFQLGAVPHAARIRNGLTATALVLVPSVLWIGGIGLVTGAYSPATAAFLNGVLGSETWTDQWQFWFLEVIVWTTLGVVGVLAFPVVDRAERRHPFGFVTVLLAAALALRFAWTGVEAGATERYTPGLVLWFFVLGWAAARAGTPARRALLAGTATLGVVGFFGDLDREAFVLAGILLLLWLPAVRLPRRVAAAVGVLASASLFVYLTHWQVYPPLEDAGLGVLAVLASLAVGIGYWLLMRPVMRTVGGAIRRGPARQRVETTV